MHSTVLQRKALARCPMVVAQRVGQIPPHARQDDGFLDAVSFKVNQAGSQCHIYRTRSLPEMRFPG